MEDINPLKQYEEKRRKEFEERFNSDKLFLNFNAINTHVFDDIQAHHNETIAGLRKILREELVGEKWPHPGADDIDRHTDGYNLKRQQIIDVFDKWEGK